MLLIGLLLGFLSVSQIEGIAYYIEDAYLDKVSDEYFDVSATRVEVVWVGAEDSGVAINLTMIKKIPVDVVGHFNLYRKSMGEYKPPSDITANAPWCVMWKDPIMLKSLATELGISPDDCPPPVGYYQTAYWQPSTEKMPDYFPGSDYKVTYTLTLKKTTLLSLVLFVTVG